MRLTALDQHRGYAQDHFQEVKQHRDTEYLSHTQAAGYQVIREPLWNKGTSCRAVGRIPHQVSFVPQADSSLRSCHV